MLTETTCQTCGCEVYVNELRLPICRDCHQAGVETMKTGSINAIDNVATIAAMSDEGKVRNLCRQLVRDARAFYRAFGHCGKIVYQSIPGLPSRFTLNKGGSHGSAAWVALCCDRKQITKRIKPYNVNPVDLYLMIMEAVESTE